MVAEEDLEGLPTERYLNLEVLFVKVVRDKVLAKLVLAEPGGHHRWRIESRFREVLEAVEATLRGSKVLEDGVKGVHGDVRGKTLREKLFDDRKDEIRFPSGGEVWHSSVFFTRRLTGKEARKAVRDLEWHWRVTEEEEATVGVIAQIDVVQSKSDHGVRSGRPGLFIHLERGVREEVRERAE